MRIWPGVAAFVFGGEFHKNDRNSVRTDKGYTVYVVQLLFNFNPRFFAGFPSHQIFHRVFKVNHIAVHSGRVLDIHVLPFQFSAGYCIFSGMNLFAVASFEKQATTVGVSINDHICDEIE